MIFRVGGITDDPVHIGWRVVWTLHDGRHHSVVVALLCPAHGEADAAIVAQLCRDVLHQHLMEHLGETLLLLGRGVAPKPPKRELRHAIDIDCPIDDRGQFRPLFAFRSIQDSHKLIANVFDERTGTSIHRLGER